MTWDLPPVRICVSFCHLSGASADQGHPDYDRVRHFEGLSPLADSCPWGAALWGSALFRLGSSGSPPFPVLRPPTHTLAFAFCLPRSWWLSETHAASQPSSAELQTLPGEERSWMPVLSHGLIVIIFFGSDSGHIIFHFFVKPSESSVTHFSYFVHCF